MQTSTQHHLPLPDHTARAHLELARARARGRCHEKVYDGRDDGRLIIDWHDIQRAARELGIRWPITIGWMSANDEPNSVGRYIGRATNKHEIRLRRGLTASDTANVLRHELGHAQQRERPDFTSFERRRDAFEADADRLARTIMHLELVSDSTTHGVPGGINIQTGRRVDPADSISPPEVQGLSEGAGWVGRR